VVISQKLAQAVFGTSVDSVDHVVRVNGRPVSIVGVLQPGFEDYSLDWVGPTEVWTSMHAGDALKSLSLQTLGPSIRLIGRVKPELSIRTARDQAQEWLRYLSGTTAAGAFRPTDIVVTPADHARVGRRVEAESFFRLLLSVCCLVLVASCAGVTNLLLEQVGQRRQEFVLRLALGATRLRLIQQLVVEASLLATGGIAAGMCVAFVGARLLAELPHMYMNLPPSAAGLTTYGAMDAKLVVVVALIGVGTVALVGVLPALMAATVTYSHSSILRPLLTWPFRMPVRQLVVMAQVALAVTAATVAGLLARGFLSVAAVDTGFKDPDSVLVARVVPRSLSWEEGSSFYEQLLVRLDSTPGVVSAALALDPPFLSQSLAVSRPDGQYSATATTSSVGARLFETLGVSLLVGREFTPRDRNAEDGLIINRELGSMLWPGDNPIGQQALWGPSRVLTTVVGVVNLPRCQNVQTDQSACGWRPFPMRNTPSYVHIRTTGDPVAFVAQLRALSRDLNPDVAIADEAVLTSMLWVRLGRQRLAAVTSAALALFGLVLGTVSCAALFVSMVRERQRDIAVCLALGIQSGALTRQILSRSVPVIVPGVGIGILGAFALSPMVAHHLYKVSFADPLTFSGAALLVSVAAVGSALYAARVAARVDPARHLMSR
jgi:predicted permease